MTSDPSLEGPLAPDEAKRELWRRGILAWKLKPYQRPLYDYLWSTLAGTVAFIEGRETADDGLPEMVHFIDCCRRWGKTHVITLVLVELCLRYPRVAVRFASQTQKALELRLHPIVKTIISDCPLELRPRFNRHLGAYEFPSSESFVQCAGVNDGHADNLRGTAAHVCVMDESAFFQDPETVQKSVLLPQLVTTRGVLWNSTTPPDSPGHPIVNIKKTSEAKGAYFCRDIYSMGLPSALVEQLKEASGGEDSASWRREFLCIWEIDPKRAVFIEWATRESILVHDGPPAPGQLWYGALDPGGRDWHGYVLGYHYFDTDQIRIEYELWSDDASSKQLAEMIKALEREAGTALGVHDFAPRKRYCDTDTLVIRDFSRDYKLSMVPAKKDLRSAQVNSVRKMMSEGTLSVHARCTTLRRQFKNAIWDKRHEDLDRIEGEGHFDVAVAAVYLVRNINRTINPYPEVRYDPASYHAPRKPVRHNAEKLFTNRLRDFER